MKRSDHRAIAAKADRYFAEQCARLGPIEGVAMPARKSAASRKMAVKMDALAESKVASRPTFRAQRLGAHDHAVDGTEMVDRFRL